MFSVALIGPDGAGKTTIALRLEKSFPLPVKYLYMGINIESSNVALPTSRFIEYLKHLRRKKFGAAHLRSTSLHHQETLSSSSHQSKKRRIASSLWAGIRLLNRLAEEWYRQALSWSYQRKGRIVIYDRHFQFDFEREGAEGEKRRLTDRWHRWCLANIYPRPDLVIYLDAPAEVLYARKGEATLQYLESRRQAFLAQGKQISNFVVVDATQPIDFVCHEVTEHIMQFYKSRHHVTKAQNLHRVSGAVREP